MGRDKASVWDMFSSIAPRLDALQRKTKSITEGPADQSVITAQYWEKIGNNLLQLVNELDSELKVRTRQCMM